MEGIGLKGVAWWRACNMSEMPPSLRHKVNSSITVSAGDVRETVKLCEAAFTLIPFTSFSVSFLYSTSIQMYKNSSILCTALVENVLSELVFFPNFIS